MPGPQYRRETARRKRPTTRSIVASLAIVGFLGFVVVGPANAATASTSSISGTRFAPSVFGAGEPACPSVALVRGAFGPSFNTAGSGKTIEPLDCYYRSKCPASCVGKVNYIDIRIFEDTERSFETTKLTPLTFFPWGIISGTHQKVTGISGAAAAWSVDLVTNANVHDDVVALEAASSRIIYNGATPDVWWVSIFAYEQVAKNSQPKKTVLSKDETLMGAVYAAYNSLYPAQVAADSQPCSAICAFAVGNDIVEMSWPDSGSPDYCLLLYFDGAVPGSCSGISKGTAAESAAANPMIPITFMELNGQDYILVTPINGASTTPCTCGVGTTVSFEYRATGPDGTAGPPSAMSNTVVTT
jgi:hypothetical protein